MPPESASSKRRRVLIEVPPSWIDRLRLRFHKLRYPRHGWLARRPLMGWKR